MKLDTTEKATVGCAVLGIVAHVVFWGAVIWAAIHFIKKFW